jgi:hypothetical protein
VNAEEYAMENKLGLSEITRFNNTLELKEVII